MIVEMADTGLTDQAIADLAGLQQSHVNRIKNGMRSNVRVSTWDSINTAYLRWQAERALAHQNKGLGSQPADRHP